MCDITSRCPSSFALETRQVRCATARTNLVHYADGLAYQLGRVVVVYTKWKIDPVQVRSRGCVIQLVRMLAF